MPAETEREKKVERYNLLLRTNPPDVDWKDITIDLGDILADLLGGGELGTLIAADQELRAREDLRVARLLRNRAGHPNAVIPGIPLNPTPEQWRCAAEAFFRACKTVEYRNILDGLKQSGSKYDHLLGELEGSGEDPSLLDVGQLLSLAFLAATSVINLDGMRRRCESDTQRAAIDRIEGLANAARMGFSMAEMSDDETRSTMSNLLGDFILAMPAAALRASAKPLPEAMASAQTRRLSLADRSLKGWYGWLVSEAVDKNGSLKSKIFDDLLRGAPKAEFNLGEKMTGVVVTNMAKRAFCFLRGANRVEYYLNYNSCDAELRRALLESEKGDRLEIEFEVRAGSGNLGQKQEAMNARIKR